MPDIVKPEAQPPNTEPASGNCDRGNLHQIGDFLLNVVSTMTFLEDVYNMLFENRDGDDMVTARTRTIDHLVDVMEIRRDQAEDIIKTAVRVINSRKTRKK